MAAHVRYKTAKGNTVPYPPLFDDIHRNHGFVDTRGCPERVSDIPEAQQSPALASLLRMLAQPDASLISLGCDLGQHEEPTARLKLRRVAGGYVQVLVGGSQSPEVAFMQLQVVAKKLEQDLKEQAGEARWYVDLDLAQVLLNFDAQEQRQSIWIWFYAKASTADRAFESRECLIAAVERSLAAPPTG